MSESQKQKKDIKEKLKIWKTGDGEWKMALINKKCSACSNGFKTYEGSDLDKEDICYSCFRRKMNKQVMRIKLADGRGFISY